MLFGHLVSGNLHLQIGSSQKEIDHMQDAKGHMHMQSVCTVYFVFTA